MASTYALHVKDNFNPEEAANAAAEFVSSLDNLPGEVTFLLEEIREKDARINQLLSRINTRHFGLTKHARSSITSSKDKDTSSGAGTTTPPFPLPLPPGTPLPSGHLSTKDAQALTKITSEFAKVQALQDEKLALAERMERIIGRARERGRAEWIKVGGMDLEEVKRLRDEEVKRGEDVAGGAVLLPSMGLGQAGGERQKKRKPHNLQLSHSLPTHTIHPPPSNSMLPPPAPRGPGRRRVDRHQSTTASLRSASEHPDDDPDADGDGELDLDADGVTDADGDGDGDLDAEGEENELEGEIGDGDDQPYCICGQKSYGEMIGCDSPDCEIEWFHVKCVGVTGTLPETWYCPACVQRLGLLSSSGRAREKKGRKAR